MNEQITVNLNNFTDEEREQFKKLLGKGSKELSKESRVWKPELNQEYYFIDDFGIADTDIWGDCGVDRNRIGLGNVFKTGEEANFAMGKLRVTTELERYALEHNDPNYSGKYYYHIIMDTEEKNIDVYEDWKERIAGATYFTSGKIAKDAIEAVGKDRILKYLFGVDCEDETDD